MRSVRAEGTFALERLAEVPGRRMKRAGDFVELFDPSVPRQDGEVAIPELDGIVADLTHSTRYPVGEHMANECREHEDPQAEGAKDEPSLRHPRVDRLQRTLGSDDPDDSLVGGHRDRCDESLAPFAGADAVPLSIADEQVADFWALTDNSAPGRVVEGKLQPRSTRQLDRVVRRREVGGHGTDSKRGFTLEPDGRLVHVAAGQRHTEGKPEQYEGKCRGHQDGDEDPTPHDTVLAEGTARDSDSGSSKR